MVTFSRLLLLLPVLGALASNPTTEPAVEATKSFDFLQHMGEIIFNTTDGNLERRDTTFSTSKDGVNSAGYYYSLYNDNHAGAGYNEDPNSGHFKLGWTLPSRSEFLGGKGFRGGSTRYAVILCAPPPFIAIANALLQYPHMGRLLLR
jgi:endo-1,4-beta-xylanase